MNTGKRSLELDCGLRTRLVALPFISCLSLDVILMVVPVGAVYRLRPLFALFQAATEHCQPAAPSSFQELRNEERTVVHVALDLLSYDLPPTNRITPPISLAIRR